CWGNNSYGSLGNDYMGTVSDVPVPVTNLSSGVVTLSESAFHTCAITFSGKLECWGYNAFAQIGDGTSAPTGIPVDVEGLSSGVIKVSAGVGHTCAITLGGTKCWGWNNAGQLGNNQTVDSGLPVDVVGL